MPRAGAAGSPADLTVVELVAAYWRHAKEYYTGHAELGSIKLALGHLKALYSCTPVADFGPLALRTVRPRMVDAGWSRRYVNRQTDKVRRMFR